MNSQYDMSAYLRGFGHVSGYDFGSCSFALYPTLLVTCYLLLY
ncbi:unnamed protein product [Brassica oleracea]